MGSQHVVLPLRSAAGAGVDIQSDILCFCVGDTKKYPDEAVCRCRPVQNLAFKYGYHQQISV